MDSGHATAHAELVAECRRTDFEATVAALRRNIGRSEALLRGATRGAARGGEAPARGGAAPARGAARGGAAPAPRRGARRTVLQGGAKTLAPLALDRMHTGCANQVRGMPDAREPHHVFYSCVPQQK